MESMSDWLDEYGSWILRPLIFAMFTFMLYALIAVLLDPSKGLKSSEAASWVQGIGTIAAVFCALWIADRDGKERRNNAFTQATIAAANMQHKVQVLHTELESVCLTVTKVAASGHPYGLVQGVIASLERAPNFSDAEIAVIAPLGKHALRLATIQSQMNNAKRLLTELNWTTTYDDGNSISSLDANQLVMPLKILDDQLRRLDSILRTIDRITKDAH